MLRVYFVIYLCCTHLLAVIKHVSMQFAQSLKSSIIIMFCLVHIISTNLKVVLLVTLNSLHRN